MERAAPDAGRPPSPDPAKSKTVVITGASGFVGGHLRAALAARGHAVRALTRGPAPSATSGSPAATWFSYEPTVPSSYAPALAGADAVVHLAGENVFGGRWTAAYTERIRASRVDTTRALVAAIAAAPEKPAVLVSATAIGYYGPRSWEDPVDEGAAPGADFLAAVCVAWEAEARKAEAAGVRVAAPRIGIVLARGGGPLAKMIPPFRWFVGGPIGGGRQPMSWIHVDDLTSMLVEAVEDDRWRGPFNATAPNPVTNREFSKALGRALHRPAFLPTPRFALRVMLGQVASIVTTGQRVRPAAALSWGYRFHFPDLDGALADLLR